MRLSDVIHSRTVFAVVVHVTPDHIALTQDIETARGEGADCIVLIKDYVVPEASDADVLRAFDFARDRYPLWPIGINLLESTADIAVRTMPKSATILWIDNSGVVEGTPQPAKYLSVIREIHQASRPESLLFASVAMKYQPEVRDEELVSKLAAAHCDVVMTSGNRTGSPPDRKKVERMARGAYPVPLGLCSGVDASNVNIFLDVGATVFLVNTSISTNGRLDRHKVTALRRKIPR